MKSNNNRAVAINSQKLDELYKEWSGEHHTTNSNKPVHDSAECCDFAEYCLKYGMEERKAKANTKSSVLHIFSVIGRFLCKVGLHNWKFSHDTGINEYYECKRCKKREVRYCHLDGYQPIDRDWLNAL